MSASSLDIMYITLAVCIAVFTVFLCWMMYYAVQILKQGNEVIQEIRQKIAELEEALMNIKEKVMSSAASITMMASQLGTVMDVVKGRSKTRRGKK